MIESFKNQDVYFGQQASAEYFSDKLIQRKARRILFVTGNKSFVESGSARFLQEANVNIQFHFNGFHPNPGIADLLEGLDYFQSVLPDCIVAIGGGSVLDMAKLINFFGAGQASPTDYIQGKIKQLSKETLLPLIAIPTTAGTGSEATHFATIYIDKTKYSVADPRMLPNTVILNPVLTERMTPYQTACTGMDALSQGIESYWSVQANEESRYYSERAIRLAIASLERAVRKPDREGRIKMQEAAYWSGRAIAISKTTAAHAMSYSLTARYGLPHGHAVAMIVPAVLVFNAEVSDIDVNHPLGIKHVRSVMDQLWKMLGVEEYTAASTQVRSLMKEIGLSGTWLSDHGHDPVIARECIAREIDLERLANNPRKVSQKSICRILETIR